VAECSAQVKEEPAGQGRRAGDTEQSTLPPRLRDFRIDELKHKIYPVLRNPAAIPLIEI
jgi:hypothetical protein